MNRRWYLTISNAKFPRQDRQYRYVDSAENPFFDDAIHHRVTTTFPGSIIWRTCTGEHLIREGKAEIIRHADPL